MAISRRITRSMTTASQHIHTEQVEHKQNKSVPADQPSPPPCRQKPSKTKVNKRKKPSKPSSTSRHPFPSILAPRFPLIQEEIADNLYFLIIQAILWNQTSGKQARPVFHNLIQRYPTPASIADASLPELTALLQPLGLHNIRAKRCIALGQAWLASPPTAERTFRRRNYPALYCSGDERRDEEWEIAHLPGVGPYALDSFRIFHRDVLRGLAADWMGSGAGDGGFEPEWKRVVPLDKELRAFLRWMWLKEGVVWDCTDGSRVRADSGTLLAARDGVL
ncbi:MAG: hypothetical protein MMC23_005336 [Stictis urceolatum]|nr:hypothetical protein [Stictis urceolata]